MASELQSFRCQREDRIRWQARADLEEVTLSEWIRNKLNEKSNPGRFELGAPAAPAQAGFKQFRSRIPPTAPANTATGEDGSN